MMHALGILHEQSRPDRDQYVTIHFDNIQDGTESNFALDPEADTTVTPYDHRSVMHYGGWAFSKNGQLTIETKDSAMQNVIGQRSAISEQDQKAINHFMCGGGE